MSEKRIASWKWAENNLAWTGGRELTTSLGPAFGLNEWFVLIPEDGCPRAVIPTSKAEAVEWLNANGAKLQLSRAPTITEIDLAPGPKQVTVAGQCRLDIDPRFMSQQIFGVFRTWVWKLEGHQPRIEPPRHDAIVYYPRQEGTPDLLVMAQLHATPDWPAFTVPQTGDTVVEPWEPVIYDSKEKSQRWAFGRPLPELEWAYPYDWRIVVQGVRTILTHQLRQRSNWHECESWYGCSKYYSTKDLRPLGDFVEGWTQVDIPKRDYDGTETREIKRFQPLIRPSLPSGKCPECDDSITHACEDPGEMVRLRSESRTRIMDGYCNRDDETEGHMEELMEWQPSMFD